MNIEDFEQKFYPALARALDPSGDGKAQAELFEPVGRVWPRLTEEAQSGLALSMPMKSHVVELIVNHWGDYYEESDLLETFDLMTSVNATTFDVGLQEFLPAFFAALNPSIDFWYIVEFSSKIPSVGRVLIEIYFRFNSTASLDDVVRIYQENWTFNASEIFQTMDYVATRYINKCILDASLAEDDVMPVAQRLQAAMIEVSINSGIASIVRVAELAIDPEFQDDNADERINEILEMGGGNLGISEFQATMLKHYRIVRILNSFRSQFRFSPEKSKKMKPWLIRTSSSKIGDLNLFFSYYFDAVRNYRPILESYAIFIGLVRNLGEKMGFEPFDHPMKRFL